MSEAGSYASAKSHNDATDGSDHMKEFDTVSLGAEQFDPATEVPAKVQDKVEYFDQASITMKDGSELSETSTKHIPPSDAETDTRSLTDSVMDPLSSVSIASSSTPRRSTTGWNVKGWLRTASSSGSSGLKTESRKKSIGQDSIGRRPTTSTSLRTSLDFIKGTHGPEKDAAIDWPLYDAMISCEPAEISVELRKTIQAGMPGVMRGVVWQSVIGSKNLELEAVYADLVIEKGDFDGQIRKDVQRMPRVWFKSLDETKLT